MEESSWINTINNTLAHLSRCRQCTSISYSKGWFELMGQKSVHRLTDDLISVLFPGCHAYEIDSKITLDNFVKTKLDAALKALFEQVKLALRYQCKVSHTENCTKCKDCEAQAMTIINSFTEQLPRIQELLQIDIRAAYEGDPAAQSRMEVVLSYPGIFAVIVQRLAHVLYKLKVPLIPRIMTEYAHSITGIDIHPGASIGEGFFIDHGTGVVIGETCVIGRNVKIYQGVTLGALSFDKDEDGNLIKGIKRHPDVGDNVVIYAGATILGGNTVIGKNAVIGGNVWLIHSVPPGSKVYNHQPAPLIHHHETKLNWYI